MTRLKFIVFALIALGLWGAQLSLSAPALSARSVEQVSLQLLGAPAAVAQQLEASRSELQAVALKLASSPLAQVKPALKPEAPAAERFNAVRGAVLESFAEATRPQVVVVVANDTGALMATGAAEPAAPPEGFDVKALASAGGQLVELNAVKHFFFSVPVVSVDKGEAKPVGSILVGAPMADLKAVAANVARDFHLAGFAFLADGKVVASAGARSDELEKWFKAAKQGETSPVERGTLVALGPLKLPMMTGAAAPVLEIAARRDLPGTPYELLAVASARPLMQALAESQKTSLLMFLGLLAAAVAFTLVMGGDAAHAAEEDEAPVKKSAAAAAGQKPAKSEPSGPLPVASPAHHGEASPDDFHFPPAPPPAATTAEAPSAHGSLPTTQEPAFVPGAPVEDPFAMAAPPPVAAPAKPMSPAYREQTDADFENERTTAYPAHMAPVKNRVTDSQFAHDPFAMAGGPPPEPDEGQALGDTDYNPDSTRVATVPQELLDAARKQHNTGSNPALPMPGATTRQMPAAPLPRMQPVAPVGGGQSPEETHFLETFRDFVATREKCGEPADGLTYEKFAAKLRKNKEQLVTKYNCKTVRFQVYVKDGKAALKATPVKD